MGAANSNTPDMTAPNGPAHEVQTELGVLDDPGRAVVTAEQGSETSASRLQVLVGATPLPLASALESLLFVADAPVEPAQFARVLNVEPAVVELVLQQLAQEYQTQGRGLRLLVRGGRYLMISAPTAAPLIEAFLNLDTSTKLSGPALETLAIVAYRQPVTRAQVEAVRGVDCSGVLRSLLQRGLLEETGRLETPGRPVLYGVTDLFLQHFGLTGMHELPPLEDASAQRLDAVLS